jgi:hypothetical protein
MNPTTLSRLLDLNRQFYQTFALPFSATRQRLQPGVRHVLASLPACSIWAAATVSWRASSP